MPSDAMTLEDIGPLARDLLPRNAGQSVLVTSADLRRLCVFILSGSMKREIENTAYRRCLDIADKAWLDHGRGKAINNLTVTQIVSDISALITPTKTADTEG